MTSSNDSFAISCTTASRTMTSPRRILDWFDELGSALVPAMKTDIVVTKRSAPRRRLVIDTEYYANSVSASPWGGATFPRRTFTRCTPTSQEHLGDLFRDADGMLLYRRPTAISADDEGAGHRIRFATVDLSKPWADVEARLLALVSDDF